MRALIKRVVSPVAFALVILPTLSNAQQYIVTDLGVPSQYSKATDINKLGHVAGTLSNQGSEFHPFLYDGTTRDLGTLSGFATYGYYLNDQDQVTGQAYTTQTGNNRHAILYDGTFHDLGTLSGGGTSEGYGINNAGRITGYSSVGVGTGYHAFIYDGTMHDIGSLGGSSQGLGINESGQVAGTSLTSGTTQHAFLWSPSVPNGTIGNIRDLGTLGGGFSFGSGVNDLGNVTGTSENSTKTKHAFMFESGTMHDLGSLGGESFGYGINNSGVVVGASYRFPNDNRLQAFVYTAATGMIKLSSLVSNLDGWEFESATAINDMGQITGGGFINNEYHAFLLTPLPEPSTFALGVLAFAALPSRRGRSVPRDRV